MRYDTHESVTEKSQDFGTFAQKNKESSTEERQPNKKESEERKSVVWQDNQRRSVRIVFPPPDSKGKLGYLINGNRASVAVIKRASPPLDHHIRALLAFECTIVTHLFFGRYRCFNSVFHNMTDSMLNVKRPRDDDDEDGVAVATHTNSDGGSRKVSVFIIPPMSQAILLYLY